MNRPSTRSLLRSPAVLVAGYGVVLALFVLGTLDREPFDDSYFFKRFALNLLDHGVLAWNVADGPVHGITSQLFQAVEVLVVAVARDHSMLVTRLFSALSALAAFAALLAANADEDGGAAPAFALCYPAALFTVWSGMETATVLALVALCLVLCYGDRGRRAHWAVAPAATVLVWLARPDAALLVSVPLCVERWKQRGRFPLREVALVGGAVALFLLAFRLYYGTALPLPFYAKQRAFSPYDAHFLELSASVRRVRFGLFALGAAPMAAVAALRPDRANLTLLGTVLAFVLFHFLGTVEVMGMHGRFYVPALPLLALAAARGPGGASRPPRAVATAAAVYAVTVAVLGASGWLPGSNTGRLEQLPALYYVPMIGGAFLLLASAAAPRLRAAAAPLILAGAAAATLRSFPPGAPVARPDAEYLRLHESRLTVYRGMDVLLSCLGDAIHVYHSEIGVPGLRFEHGSVTDLAGLMSPAWLFRERTFDETCLTEHPEAIFLPHRNYRSLNDEILRGQCIRGYTRMIAESASPLYVRNDLVGRYERCAATPSDPPRSGVPAPGR